MLKLNVYYILKFKKNLNLVRFIFKSLMEWKVILEHDCYSLVPTPVSGNSFEIATRIAVNQLVALSRLSEPLQNRLPFGISALSVEKVKVQG